MWRSSTTGDALLLLSEAPEEVTADPCRVPHGPRGHLLLKRRPETLAAHAGAARTRSAGRPRKQAGANLVHDVVDFVPLAVQDDTPLLFELQVLEERAVGLVLLVVVDVPHVDGRHLPLLFGSGIQHRLQGGQA